MLILLQYLLLEIAEDIINVREIIDDDKNYSKN